ncbi:hypothetical protein CLF_107753 [Clonorchis sinensis]|uniref:Uncharacterized protein n=1 Tax=Clonorchis sinensis TaxID=79923 RepID=G7YH60_CLOSI|nr:hypothetical protein CLF_107753 [Clonorchis sinensis]
MTGPEPYWKSGNQASIKQVNRIESYAVKAIGLMPQDHWLRGACRVPTLGNDSYNAATPAGASRNPETTTTTINNNEEVVYSQSSFRQYNGLTQTHWVRNGGTFVLEKNQTLNAIHSAVAADETTWGRSIHHAVNQYVKWSYRTNNHHDNSQAALCQSAVTMVIKSISRIVMTDRGPRSSALVPEKDSPTNNTTALLQQAIGCCYGRKAYPTQDWPEIQDACRSDIKIRSDWSKVWTQRPIMTQYWPNADCQWCIQNASEFPESYYRLRYTYEALYKCS